MNRCCGSYDWLYHHCGRPTNNLPSLSDKCLKYLERGTAGPPVLQWCSWNVDTFRFSCAEEVLLEW